VEKGLYFSSVKSKPSNILNHRRCLFAFLESEGTIITIYITVITITTITKIIIIITTIIIIVIAITQRNDLFFSLFFVFR